MEPVITLRGSLRRDHNRRSRGSSDCGALSRQAPTTTGSVNSSSVAWASTFTTFAFSGKAEIRSMDPAFASGSYKGPATSSNTENPCTGIKTVTGPLLLLSFSPISLQRAWISHAEEFGCPALPNPGPSPIRATGLTSYGDPAYRSDSRRSRYPMRLAGRERVGGFWLPSGR
jgi:hypothetical protein